MARVMVRFIVGIRPWAGVFLGFVFLLGVRV
jgi:hypothetical protein